MAWELIGRRVGNKDGFGIIVEIEVGEAFGLKEVGEEYSISRVNLGK